jgi:hypothetical protein
VQLHEQIIKAVRADKDKINQLKHGVVTIVIQDGLAIRLEKLEKTKIENREG